MGFVVYGFFPSFFIFQFGSEVRQAISVPSEFCHFVFDPSVPQTKCVMLIASLPFF